MSNPIKTHVLPIAEYAYDTTQTSEDIESGDTLIVEDNEGNVVVGFMLDAWPVAVTVATGQFHSAKEDKDPEGLYEGSNMKPCAIAFAVKKAREMGLKVQPCYDNVETD